MPASLIHIGDSEDGAADNSKVKVYLTKAQDRGLMYCTLSHCWGGAQDITKLVMETFHAFQDALSFESLPCTFQETVKITKALE